MIAELRSCLSPCSIEYWEKLRLFVRITRRYNLEVDFSGSTCLSARVISAPLRSRYKGVGDAGSFPWLNDLAITRGSSRAPFFRWAGTAIRVRSFQPCRHHAVTPIESVRPAARDRFLIHR